MPLDLAALIYQDSPNQNPVSLTFDTRQDYRISKTIVDRLAALNDPRLPIYAQPTDDAPHGYVGVPNGLLTGDANNLGLSKTSRPGDYFRAPHAPAVIISYAEVLFDLSEAVSRGFTTGDAADLYNKAVLASLGQYGITDATQASMIQDYLTSWSQIPYAGPSFIYTTIDINSASSDPNQTLGVVRSDGTWKPAAYVIQQWTAAHPQQSTTATMTVATLNPATFGAARASNSCELADTTTNTCTVL